ncbi:energy transducer TonB [Phenylobacterium sp.]|uniref:energy transducer TonB n=1 Tax=Phenylobacterium sp. TaxID=1871053 RepID=UPI002D1ADC98|nr:energy transducer TonB [Phenylobacterium sp.]HLZ76019.1 energy transducer TonB [Phenylobacterium sp.]
MLAAVLALMAAADPQATAAKPPAAPAATAATSTVSPVTVSPESKAPAPDLKIDMQSDDDDISRMVVIWPGTAYAARLDGRVNLRCKVDVHGLAEWCEVTNETPRNKGFGKAALEMRPTFKLPIAQGPDGPVPAMRNIALTFKAPDTTVTMAAVLKNGSARGMGNALAMRQVTMLNYPVWVQAATFEDLAAAYPAKANGAEGYAVAHCHLLHTGLLTTCQVIAETPDKLGFGKAALDLAKKFRVAPDLAAVRQATPVWVDVPIRWPAGPALADRTVMAPVWITGVDLKSAPGVFPPEAAGKGLTSGRGVARCVVGVDGTLTQCAPEAADPDGLGFSEAAVKLASTMKMNLWSADGEPVEGGVIHIPIRLGLKGAN